MIGQPGELLSSAAPAAAAGGGQGTDSLGARAHVQQTLDRVRAAIAASRRRNERSRGVLAHAESRADESARLLQESALLESQLRAAVAAYATRLRMDGLPPEKMLVLVKTAVRESTPRELDPDAARTLSEDVVRWSIDAYYAA